MALLIKVWLFSIFSCVTLASQSEKPFYIIEHADYYFKDFEITYNKQYANASERLERFKIFTENLKVINEKNSIDTATHGVNQFADLRIEEFLERYTGFVPSARDDPSCGYKGDADVNTNSAPESWDWRQQKVVTPVKNQGSCGSCYAFSTVGNIESQYAIHNNGELLDLSEQQLVSCSLYNNRCHGGAMIIAMEYIMQSGGIELEKNYPYVNFENESHHDCKFNRTLAKVQLKGCTVYTIKDEDKLKEELYKNGPISVALAGDALHKYTGGVLSDCPPGLRGINHAVLLVGYGTDENNTPYWILKNSWGSNWGEQGFFRLVRGQNTCLMINILLSSAIIA